MKQDTRAEMLSKTTRHHEIGDLLVSFHDAPSEIETDWRALEANGIGSIFQSYAWCDAWCRVAATRAGESPLIVAGRTQNGRIAFILPMATRQAWRTMQLTWLAQSCFAHNMGLYAPHALQRLDQHVLSAVLKAACTVRPGLAMACFDGQPASWDGHGNPFATLQATASSQSLYGMRFTQDFETEYADRFRSRRRRKLARSENRLIEHGVEIQPSAQDGCIGRRPIDIFDAFRRQKSDQLARAGFENIFERPEVVDFYRDIMIGPATAPSFDAAAVWYGDDLVASAISVQDHTAAYILMLSRTEGPLATHSPGRLAVKHAIARHVQAGTKRVDFGAGWSALKEAWHCERLERFDTTIVLRTAGLIPTGLIRTRKRLEAAVRAQPMLFRPIRALLHRVRRARARLRGKASRSPTGDG